MLDPGTMKSHIVRTPAPTELFAAGGQLADEVVQSLIVRVTAGSQRPGGAVVADNDAVDVASAAVGSNGRPSNPVTIRSDGRGEFILDPGAVVIAAITSCTNTSNPEVMLAAALLARNAVEKGLSSKPWVKSTMAPGSHVVSDYYDKARLWPYLEKLGFYLVGYGCTTCIGNSGPLPEEISKAVNDNDLSVAAVLSGNRNFEGRINPDVKMNTWPRSPQIPSARFTTSIG